MTSKKKYTVEYVKKFTGGHLKGLIYEGSISFPTKRSAETYILIGKKGIKKPIGGSPYKFIKAKLIE
jgi:hypothetical protein